MRLNKLGRYDLIRVLGKGAMGLVYEARDPNLDRRVAIKTIRVENRQTRRLPNTKYAFALKRAPQRACNTPILSAYTTLTVTWTSLTW